MIYIDSCIPMYLIGAEHPCKAQVIDGITRFLQSQEILVTSAETFQEITHRYKSIKNLKHLSIAYEALENAASEVFDVTKKDADLARTFAIEYKKLSSRDCLHAAVMKRIQCDKIWTFDVGFDEIPWVQRVC